VHRPDDGEPTDELGDQAELEEILRQDAPEERSEILVGRSREVGPEADAAVAVTALDDRVEPGERTPADEQDVRGVIIPFSDLQFQQFFL